MKKSFTEQIKAESKGKQTQSKMEGKVVSMPAKESRPVAALPTGKQTQCRVISFTSGKGGVGKTTIACNIALSLAQTGNRVLLLDADVSLANVDVILGVSPKHTLRELLEGTKTLQEILVQGPEGISIIPATSGNETLSQLSTAQKLILRQEIETIAPEYDYVLVDTAAGLGPDVLFFNTASQEIVVIINDEPTSLTDAYALVKVLSQRCGEKSIAVVVNGAEDEQGANRTFNRFSAAIERFLHIRVKFLGFLPKDPLISEAIRSRQAVLQMFPSCPAGRALARLARRIDDEFYERGVKGGLQFMFDRLLEVPT